LNQLASFACCLLNAGFFLGGLFNPEDGAEIILQNICWLSTGYELRYIPVIFTSKQSKHSFRV
jgi:hypothetical protein